LKEGIMAKEKATDVNIFRHAAVLVEFGATFERNALCAACGFETGKTFTLTVEGLSQTITGDMTECQLGHILAESLGGKLSDGFFPLHKVCNQTNTVWFLDIFCAKWQTVLTAHEIRTRYAKSQIRAERMISGHEWHSDIALVAQQLLDRLANYRRRVPQDQQKKIKAA
jgi:hypothetical protein